MGTGLRQRQREFVPNYPPMSLRVLMYLGRERGQGGQKQDIEHYLDMGGPYPDRIGGNAQGVETEDGEDMDDDAREGRVRQVSSGLSRRSSCVRTLLTGFPRSCFTRAAYQISETEAHMKKSEIKQGVYKVITMAVKFHGHAFGSSIHGEQLNTQVDKGSAHRRTDADHAELDVFRALGGANGRIAECLGEGV